MARRHAPQVSLAERPRTDGGPVERCQQKVHVKGCEGGMACASRRIREWMNHRLVGFEEIGLYCIGLDEETNNYLSNVKM